MYNARLTQRPIDSMVRVGKPAQEALCGNDEKFDWTWAAGLAIVPRARGAGSKTTAAFDG